MTNYTGIKCPVCGKPFRDGDDIVVCPVCGAPYHRACYAKVGKCIFTDKHGTAEAWVPQREEKGGPNEGSKHCPRCGYVNSENALFCEHCGMSLTDEPQNHSEGTPFPDSRQTPPYGFGGYSPYGGRPQPCRQPYPGQQSGRQPYPGQQQPGQQQPGQQQPGQQPKNSFGGQVPFYFDPMGGVNPNEPIGNVPAGDVAKFVQNNTQYYLPVFMNLKQFGKNRFNFSAFLFPGAWMLYRKQYRIGSIVTAVTMGLYIACFYIQQNLWYPLYNTLMTQAGISSGTASPTTEQMARLYALLYSLPSSQMLLFFTPTLLTVLQLVLMFVFGFIGNKLYLKHCLSSVLRIRQSTAVPADIPLRLQEQGGVNMSIAVCFAICYMILMYLPLLL